MKLPKRVKLNGLWYKIELCDEINLPDDCLAQTTKARQLIQIGKDLSADIKTQVLFHEMYHAQNWELDEKEVENISQNLCQILFDNQNVARRFVRRRK